MGRFTFNIIYRIKSNCINRCIRYSISASKLIWQIIVLIFIVSNSIGFRIKVERFDGFRHYEKWSNCNSETKIINLYYQKWLEMDRDCIENKRRKTTTTYLRAISEELRYGSVTWNMIMRLCMFDNWIWWHSTLCTQCRSISDSIRTIPLLFTFFALIICFKFNYPLHLHVKNWWCFFALEFNQRLRTFSTV